MILEGQREESAEAYCQYAAQGIPTDNAAQNLFIKVYRRDKMKKSTLTCIILALILSLGGVSFAGHGNNKDKGHDKGNYKEDKGYKEKKHGHGPPPHAPAHGYRCKHDDGVDLEYNTHSGMYVVIGFDNHYFRDNNFFRIIDGTWKKSEHISGPWLPAPKSILPPGLPPLPPLPPLP
jgi:hypothetical protein